jgi:hypothetical protein
MAMRGCDPTTAQIHFPWIPPFRQPTHWRHPKKSKTATDKKTNQEKTGRRVLGGSMGGEQWVGRTLQPACIFPKTTRLVNRLPSLSVGFGLRGAVAGGYINIYDLPRGVTVALQILDLFVMVRIHARQPMRMGWPWGLGRV